MSSKGYESSAIFYNALHVGEVEKLAGSLYSYLFPSGAPDETTVLDLGCGTGTLLAELQRLGMTGVGVDISPDMVKVAQTRHPSLKFTASDMSNVRLDREFDLVLCTNDAINYIHSDSREAVFATIARHLNRRGRGYIDFDTETDIVKFWDGQVSETIGDGWRLVRKNAYAPISRVGTETQEWIIDDADGVEVFTEKHILYPLNPLEIAGLALSSGLFVDHFIEPVAMIRVDHKLSSYLRLGCIIRWSAP